MDRNNNDISTCGIPVERLVGNYEFQEVYNLNTRVPNVSTLGAVAIIDMANFLFQYSGNFKQIRDDAQAYFLSGNIFERQQAIIKCLQLYEELHIVIRMQNQNYLEIGRRFQHLCPSQSVFIHRVQPKSFIDYGKVKEVDDVACLHLRECFLKEGIIPIIVSNDQYRSFSSNIANSYKVDYSSTALTPGKSSRLSSNFFEFNFENVSPNLCVLDPDSRKLIVCPSFPRNTKKSDWIKMNIWLDTAFPKIVLSESNDVEMTIFESALFDHITYPEDTEGTTIPIFNSTIFDHTTLPEDTPEDTVMRPSLNLNTSYSTFTIHDL